jgi:S-methylmethionine-dependent homocysteine/selenocysteine methylase
MTPSLEVCDGAGMSETVSLDDRLAGGPAILIDGGTGTEIERQGATMHPGAWSAIATLTDPDVVRGVHLSFLQAGAEIIIANTYPANFHVMASSGLEDEFEPANRNAVRLAMEAREEYRRSESDRPVWIAGSMSTTTFSPALDSSVIESVESHGKMYRAQARILAEEGVDLIILEMMRDVHETSLCLDAALQTGLPVWLGMSAEGDEADRLNLFGSSDPFSEGVAAILDRPDQPQAVGVMHSELTVTPQALESLSGLWDGARFAYPHHGIFEMPHWRFDNTLTPAEFGDAALEWVSLGAAAVGGCCGIRPEHIAATRRRLDTQIDQHDHRA